LRRSEIISTNRTPEGLEPRNKLREALGGLKERIGNQLGIQHETLLTTDCEPRLAERRHDVT
jgi:hypothetical protein